MTRSRFTRHGLVVVACSVLVLGVAACDSSGGSDSGSGSGKASSTPSRTGPDDAQPPPTSADATELAAQVRSKFTQETYRDSSSGKTLPYNIFLPEGYSSSKEYPVVLFIGDSSLVGQDVTAPLSQYGALVWASDRDQQEHESIVLVPEYPSVIIDDRDGYSTTEYVEMTARFLQSIEDKYSVDENSIYGTGQSMGCMTILYLAAKDPDLFAAELLVSGQWDKGQLKGLVSQKFFYIAAGGDSRSVAGQKDLEALMKDTRTPYGTATFDATWSERRLNEAAEKLLGDGDSANFATFETGTVLEAGGHQSDGPGPGGGVAEHMASFEPAYKIPAVRDWLFEQTDD
ncbi:alpha/beta hydrolase-fold protein [Aeromicrobium chenweiae]|uniref:Esterase n=1 Tax=Aeromicrobium chenweiae TaxID=2079793 RepID=A0A2S0WMU5_9ACTN|nr:alpha/beta hydrolase-fold protein [Aeromicrobium chenweiae]AWB92590.1 esterase [Aeromicrobium chenweiae]TGN33577.1 esterase [Aeromicrobium chenweiae]